MSNPSAACAVPAAAPRLADVTASDHELALRWSDGRHDRLGALWLRDGCGCPSCRHPGNGQRLVDIASLPESPRIGAVRVDDTGAVTVEFADDGHTSRFTADWLRARGRPADPLAEREAWHGGRPPPTPRATYDEVRTTPAALRDWLAAFWRAGFAVLEGVPCESGMVERVTALFAPVHETNYGRHFDVRVVPEPVNLAYTGLALAPHTDNPYREPPPGLQLLHCLRNSAGGGANLLVDGLRAALDLRAADPEAFDLLSRHRVPFRFQSADTVLDTRGHLIEVDDRGVVTGVRYNNRSVAPLDLPTEALARFYRAYRRFAERLLDPSAALRLRLAPGEGLLMDNRRLLHGREAYDGGGERWLQGCYADGDALLSRLAVLRLGTAETSA